MSDSYTYGEISVRLYKAAWQALDSTTEDSLFRHTFELAELALRCTIESVDIYPTYIANPRTIAESALGAHTIDTRKSPDPKDSFVERLKARQQRLPQVLSVLDLLIPENKTD